MLFHQQPMKPPSRKRKRIEVDMEEFFNPYTFDYKTYIKETYGLNEMPTRLSPLSDIETDYIDNSFDAMKVEKRGKLIGRLQHGNENLRVYQEVEGNKVWISILSENIPIIAAGHVYQRIETPIKGIINLGIHRFKLYRHVIWRWFEERVIPNEPTIISDKAQTDKGFNFWKQLFDEYVKEKKTHKMSVIDFRDGSIIKEIVDKKEMDGYFQAQSTGNFRFVLQRI